MQDAIATLATEALPDGRAQVTLWQITDCHLLGQPEAVYQGVRPYQHLQRILTALRPLAPPLILTGDLTEDHSAASYQLLQQLLADWPAPVFLLPGNHDERQALAQMANQPPFMAARRVNAAGWQLWLLDTKGATPAGAFPPERLAELTCWAAQNQTQPVFWFCHHHLLPVGSFIDRFDQQDKTGLLSLLRQPHLRGLAHGHCHHGYALQQADFIQVGCPASSVQFLQTADWQTIDAGPQACRWQFCSDGSFRFDFVRF